MTIRDQVGKKMAKGDQRRPEGPQGTQKNIWEDSGGYLAS